MKKNIKPKALLNQLEVILLYHVKQRPYHDVLHPIQKDLASSLMEKGMLEDHDIRGCGGWHVTITPFGEEIVSQYSPWCIPDDVDEYFLDLWIESLDRGVA